ncbi:hypothetical protein J4217_02660 [Candidatus Pacearchaeota archaeon]|nr:hypothetical protein [Candidatus Pacearchaeota archaeon]
MATLLQSPFFVEMVLPFLLVFTIVFAVLQKSEILGKGKKQIDALVALAIGLILVAFGNYAQIIAQMSAFLGVALVIILVFLLLTGIFYEPGKFELHKGVKYTGMGLAALAVIIAVLYYTNSLGFIIDAFKGEGSTLLVNVIFVVIIVAAVAALIWGGGKAEGGSGEKK